MSHVLFDVTSCLADAKLGHSICQLLRQLERLSVLLQALLHLAILLICFSTDVHICLLLSHLQHRRQIHVRDLHASRVVERLGKADVELVVLDSLHVLYPGTIGVPQMTAST